MPGVAKVAHANRQGSRRLLDGAAAGVGLSPVVTVPVLVLGVRASPLAAAALLVLHATSTARVQSAA